MRRRAAG